MPKYKVDVAEQALFKNGVIVVNGQQGTLKVSSHEWRFLWVDGIDTRSIAGSGGLGNYRKVGSRVMCEVIALDGTAIRFMFGQFHSSSILSTQSVSEYQVSQGFENTTVGDFSSTPSPPTSTATAPEESTLNNLVTADNRSSTPSPTTSTATASEESTLSGSAQRLELLGKAADLRSQGVLTDEEFGEEKRRILSQSTPTVSPVSETSSAPNSSAAPTPPPMTPVPRPEPPRTVQPAANSPTGNLARPSHRTGWRKMTWVILLWNLLMVAWIITGLATNHGNCNGLSQQACSAAHDIGGGIAAGLIAAVWVAGDVILLILWLVTNQGVRTCPACGTSAKKGITSCRRCGFDFSRRLYN